MDSAVTALSVPEEMPAIALSEEDLAQVAGGAKLDLTLKKDVKDDVTFGVGVKFDNGWAVGGSVGTDGSAGVSVTIPL
ncbi:MAG: hypothetical protein IRY87_07685 [Acetobacteraceae bacterium]|nr:hypothetical protein [Acetobacteraceae bacterium]